MEQFSEAPTCQGCDRGRVELAERQKASDQSIDERLRDTEAEPAYSEIEYLAA